MTCQNCNLSKEEVGDRAFECKKSKNGYHNFSKRQNSPDRKHRWGEKLWDKEINTRYFSILITNYLRLGFSIKKTPKILPHYYTWFHINLWCCQIQFYKLFKK